MTQIQIVIPVNDADRPLSRAIDSVLRSPHAGVVVVAHNISPSSLNIPQDPRVKVLSFVGEEGKVGPAFDAGIEATDAPWIGIMGSDDWYETEALEAMSMRAEQDNADGVLAPLAYQGNGRGMVPLTLRRKNLHPVRDRMFYRSAPLGIYRREILRDERFRFGDRHYVGSDIAVSARLWTSGLRVSYYPEDPAYVVGDDARRRVTTSPRPLAERGAAWKDLWDLPWVRELSGPVRTSLAVKLLRVHVWGELAAHPNPEWWSQEDSSWLEGLTSRILSEAPGVLEHFRRPTVRTFQKVSEGNLEGALKSFRLEESATKSSLVLPSRLGNLLSPEAPPRSVLTAVLGEARRKLKRDTKRRNPILPIASSEVAPEKPSLAILSFSPIESDARVLRQVELFKKDFAVTTVGYGEAPDGVTGHIELPSSLSPTELSGKLITARAYALAYWSMPAIRNAWNQIRQLSVENIIANDAEALPLALRLSPTGGVHADLHEHFPSLHAHNPDWRRRISPYYASLLKRYLPKAKSSSTVSTGLQRAYEAQFGLKPDLVVNAAPYAPLEPTNVGPQLRLVYAGASHRRRRLDMIVDAAIATRNDVSLDLYLTLTDPVYLAELQSKYQTNPRITFHDAVPYAQLAETLNAYDIGIAVYPPQEGSLNQRWNLPNKLFEYVQARIGIVTGPSPEMIPYLENWGIGTYSEAFTVSSLVHVFDELKPSEVKKWKANSKNAAVALAAEKQSDGWERHLRG